MVMSAVVLPMSASIGVLALPQRLPLRGGTLTSAVALTLMNGHFFVSVRDGEVGIFRIEDDGTITFVPPEQFALLLANIFVDLSGNGPQGSGKIILVAKFWLSHPNRRSCKRIVFEPSGNIDPDEYNLWRGFAVAPVSGFQRQRRFLRHIYRVICRRDKEKFKYLMRWLAWSVQNPHRHAEVVIVLISAAEGSGKSTLGNVMLDIFGPAHGLLVDNKEQLLGTFNSHLETTCFVLGEEVLWAGDPKTSDALKSRVTASVIPIEAKYRQRRQVPNRLHVILTTNHSWAIAAGVQARRYFVCEVSDEVAQDPAWFGPLYQDLDNGGKEEFLHLLLNLKLGTWHPRQVPKTAELVDQQLRSAGTTEPWLLACAEIDSLAGSVSPTQLSSQIATSTLYDAYAAYTRTRGLRVESVTVFGKLLTKLFGPSQRLSATYGLTRPPGYSIPTANGIEAAVHNHLKT
jgi:Family of unknown function (DUF5906)